MFSTTYNLQASNSQPDKAFGGLIGRHNSGGLVVDQCSVKNATFQYNNYSFSSRLYFGGLVGWNDVTFADQSTPRHEFTNCEFANVDDNRLSLQSSTAAFGGILGYSNSTTLSPAKMHFSDLLIRKSYSTIAVKSTLNDVYVGAVIGRTSNGCTPDGFQPGVRFYANSGINATLGIRAKCPENKTYYTGGRYYWYTDDAHYNYEGYGVSDLGDKKKGLVGNITDYEPSATFEGLNRWQVIINME